MTGVSLQSLGISSGYLSRRQLTVLLMISIAAASAASSTSTAILLSGISVCIIFVYQIKGGRNKRIRKPLQDNVGIEDDETSVHCTVQQFVPERPIIVNTIPIRSEYILSDSEHSNWAILLPITSRNLTEQQCWQNMYNITTSLAATTTADQRKHVMVYIGVDDDDILYGNTQTQQKLQACFADRSIQCVVCIVSCKYPGRVCAITNQLAAQAISKKAEFLVLLGDDIELLDKNWKSQIEAKFGWIATRNHLPFGVGCVAFYDTKFEGFPTFPVIHKTHFEIFEQMFPETFINQDGDPYLFAVYTRFNAAYICKQARLSNTIGGKEAARYTKKPANNWKETTLSIGIERVKLYLKLKKPENKETEQQAQDEELKEEACHIFQSASNTSQEAFAPSLQKQQEDIKKAISSQQEHDPRSNRICLDVVIPTFRCNKQVLRQLTSIAIPDELFNPVTFIVVVDNPKAQKICSADLEHPQDDKRIIRVIHNSTNLGVSISRNIGIQSSTADYVLFMDDDVTPSRDILQHYYDAIRANRGSSVFVGCTLLPKPCNIWTLSMRVSGITYFYDIAKKMQHPPWGVTANLCARIRQNNLSENPRFDCVYPKTGGGEDIDFCFQYAAKEPSIVSVPKATACHPWWNKGNVCMKHICGWAVGDSLCMARWPQKSFLSVPNTPELIFLLFVRYCVQALYANRFEGVSVYFLMVSIAILIVVDLVVQTAEFYSSLQFIEDLQCNAYSIVYKVIICMTASFILLLQESTRLSMHLLRLELFNLFFRFDFMGDGHMNHQRALQKILLSVSLMVAAYLFYEE